MSRLGLGRRAWLIVGAMTVLNWYGAAPSVSGIEVVAAGVGLFLGAFIWVHILRAVFVVVFGGSDDSGNTPVESHDM